MVSYAYLNEKLSTFNGWHNKWAVTEWQNSFEQRKVIS